MIETEEKQEVPAEETPAEAPEETPKKQKKAKRRKKKDLMRIEELEKLMAETGGDVDPDTVVSMYMPRRKRKLLAASLLRLDKLRLCLLALLLA